MLDRLDGLIVGEPGEVGRGPKVVQQRGRLGKIAGTGKRGREADAVEDGCQGFRVSVGLVNTAGLDAPGIEEQIPGGENDDRHTVPAQSLHLSRQPIDAAEGIARAAARFEIPLEVGHDRQSQARGRLGGGTGRPSAAQSQA